MTDKTEKTFDTLAVAGVYTGYLLQEGGFSGIHEVMDHLFPGIMTIGVAAMQPTAAERIAGQLPELAAVGQVENGDWKAYAERAVAALGHELRVTGPLDVSETEIAAAFKNFGARS